MDLDPFASCPATPSDLSARVSNNSSLVGDIVTTRRYTLWHYQGLYYQDVCCKRSVRDPSVNPGVLKISRNWAGLSSDVDVKGKSCEIDRF